MSAAIPSANPAWPHTPTSVPPVRANRKHAVCVNLRPDIYRQLQVAKMRGRTARDVIEEALAIHFGLLPTRTCRKCGARFNPGANRGGRTPTHCMRHRDHGNRPPSEAGA